MTNLFEDKTNSYEITFKNTDYVVNIFVDTQLQSQQNQGNEKLCIEIEDKVTAERWKGVFDSTYIEDLTRKTGNFKQFIIFVNMLETALTRASEAVNLELFTYNDLEQLRNKKANNNSSLFKSSNSSLSNLNNNNNNKRYLILTYNVEFDRIHYPLQLNYQGKPDPAILQDIIRKLRNELQLYRSQTNNDTKRNEFIKLQRDYERVLKEKEALELDLDECNNKLKESLLNTSEAMQREIKTLKEMIKNIEEDSLKEKSTFQKQLHKKIKENNQLIEEINELKSSERNLKHQVKSLQNEIAVYRRNRVFNNSSIDSTLRKTRSRESSRESSLTRTKYNHTSRNDSTLNNHRRDRSLSRESLTRGLKSDRVGSAGSTRRTSLRDRSTSRERDRELALVAAVASGLKSNRSRSNSYDRSRNGQMQRSNRVKTPSPSHSVTSNGSNSSRRQRFDPTEYIKDKTRKLEEAELKKKRQINRNMNHHDKIVFNSKNDSNGKIRTPSVSSINSGIDSDNDSINSFDSRSKATHRKSKYEKQKINDLESWSATQDLLKNNLKSVTTSSTPNNTISTASIGLTKHTHKYANNKKPLNNDNYYLNDTNNTNNEDYDENGSDTKDNFNFYNREKEIKEIDARLKSLQLFMKNNMP